MLNVRKCIALTIDDKYLQHCCVMLESLMAFHPEELTVYIIYSELSDESIALLNRHFKHSKFTFKFYSIQNFDFSILAIRPNDHVSIATYFRILLPDILVDEEQVLFLDTDIIVNNKIDELFDVDISNIAVAAVEDTSVGSSKKESLGIADSKRYFNAGVLLINLAYFRRNNLTSQILLFIKNHPEKCEFWDQDALNATIKGDFYQLPYKYNLQSDLFPYAGKDQEILKGLKDPAIVHFSGGGYCKPWFYHNQHPYKKLYYKYLRNTPFKDYREPDRPNKLGVLKNFMKRKLLRLTAF